MLDSLTRNAAEFRGFKIFDDQVIHKGLAERPGATGWTAPLSLPDGVRRTMPNGSRARNDLFDQA
jgi:hypothetical protein